MEGELVLFRHGSAEKSGLIPDFDRALTPEGIKKTKKAAEGLRILLKGKSVTLYSSPLIRAVQTAEILAKKLDIPFSQQEWIADGSRYHLMKAIEQSENTLIIVGHQPTLSEWHYELTDEFFEYKKSGAALLRITQSDLHAECIWAYTRKELEAIGKKKKP